MGGGVEVAAIEKQFNITGFAHEMVRMQMAEYYHISPEALSNMDIWSFELAAGWMVANIKDSNRRAKKNKKKPRK